MRGYYELHAGRKRPLAEGGILPRFHNTEASFDSLKANWMKMSKKEQILASLFHHFGT
jgi:hypothetical protein